MLVNSTRMEKSISERPLTSFGLPLVFFFILITEEKMEIENILIPHIGLFDKKQTKTYLENSRVCTVMTAEKVLGILKNGGNYEEAEKYIMDTFYHGHMKEIYPVNALKLNTGIMVKLIEKELILGNE